MHKKLTEGPPPRNSISLEGHAQTDAGTIWLNVIQHHWEIDEMGKTIYDIERSIGEIMNDLDEE